MARLKRYLDSDDRRETYSKTTSLMNDRGDKRYGFVSKDRLPDETIRYGLGIDNLPGNNDYYKELQTLLGTLDFGKEGDTAYAGFSPNFGIRANKWGVGEVGNDRPIYNAEVDLPGNMNLPNINLDKTLNTPIGNLNLQTYMGTPDAAAFFEPNDRGSYYINALVNLLRGRR